MSMKNIYGPVNSRRLGASLGINLIPYKTCSFNCIYCQLGSTRECTIERREYIPQAEILAELKLWLDIHPAEAKEINYISFSGSGEPTLYDKIGQLATQIKKITNAPLAIITNSSLLSSASVRRELLEVELIVPSLDAVTKDLFERVDRPHANLRIEEVIEGLINLGKEFKGKIWLETMLIKGMNDDLRQIRKLKETLDMIKPDKIHLNSPVRMTAEANILGVDKKKLVKIKEILGDNCEII